MIEIKDWFTGERRLRHRPDSLAGAKLRGASLRYADLRNQVLRGANLQKADLRGALLWNTDLRGADLTDALLGYFDMVEFIDDPGADLTGVNLRGAIYDAQTRWPDGFAPQYSGARLENAPPAPARMAPGPRTFAIGDVHGQTEKLRKLLAKLKALAASGDALVFIGDLIDRGPDSRGSINLVLEQLGGGWPGPVTVLKGNHEAMLLSGLDGDPEFTRDAWFRYGGISTLQSYGVGWQEEEWQGSIPAGHVGFLRSLKTWHRDAHGIYVHAGLHPGQAPEETGEEILLWTREAFYTSDHEWDLPVVFGHTPMYEPPVAMNRQPAWRPMLRTEKIGIDTGAGYGGPLTAVVLPQREFVFVP